MAESEFRREVVWTQSAKADLQSVYEFNISLLGEEKVFAKVEQIMQKADVLHHKIIGGARFISKKYPTHNYQKLIIGHYLLIYRQIGEVVFINRIFDTRQDPSKLDL